MAKRARQLSAAEVSALKVASLLLGEGWPAELSTDIGHAVAQLLLTGPPQVGLVEQAGQLVGGNFGSTSLGELEAIAQERGLRVLLVAIPDRPVTKPL